MPSKRLQRQKDARLSATKKEEAPSMIVEMEALPPMGKDAVEEWNKCKEIEPAPGLDAIFCQGGAEYVVNNPGGLSKFTEDTPYLDAETFSPEAVNHPKHYTVGGIETIDFLQAKLSTEAFYGFCVANCIKYLARADHKSSRQQDLEKAEWYIKKAIEAGKRNV
jgi:hypothetical protein